MSEQRRWVGPKSRKRRKWLGVIMREEAVHALNVTVHDPIKRAWKACKMLIVVFVIGT